MTYVVLTSLAVALLSGGTLFLRRRRNRTRRGPSGNNHSQKLSATSLTGRFWLEFAVYVGGFALAFGLLFGHALAVYLGYGDLA